MVNYNEIIGKLYTEIEEYKETVRRLKASNTDYEKRVSHTETILSRFHKNMMNDEFYNDVRMCLHGLDNHNIKISDLITKYYNKAEDKTNE